MTGSEYCYVPSEIRDLEKFLWEHEKKEEWSRFMSDVGEMFSEALEPHEKPYC